MALLLGKRVEDVDREMMDVINEWLVVEGVVGMVKEEERLVGWVSFIPALSSWTPVPLYLRLLCLHLLWYHVCDGPIGLRHED